jgi:Fe2+ transport system protein FeoA
VLGATPKGLTQERAITEGRQVCDIFEAGGVGTNVVSRLLDLGMTQDEALRVVFAATVSFCPEYELDAQR